MIIGAMLLIASIARAAPPPTVVDDAGEAIVLPDVPASIVSLAPHVTELLFDLGVGDRIKGTVRFSDYPEAAKLIPRIGDAFAMNIEAITAMQPDLIIGWLGGGNARAINRLRQLGFVVYMDQPKGLGSIPERTRRIGRLLGRESTSAALAAAFDRRLETLGVSSPGPDSPSVFFQISDQSLYTVNDQHIIGESIRHCGGRNIFGSIEIAVPLVSIEAVVAGAPDIIVISQPADAEDSGWIGRWQGYTIPAVATDRVRRIDASLISRPGLRMAEGIQSLCDIIGDPAHRVGRGESGTRNSEVVGGAALARAAIAPAAMGIKGAAMAPAAMAIEGAAIESPLIESAVTERGSLEGAGLVGESGTGASSVGALSVANAEGR